MVCYVIFLPNLTLIIYCYLLKHIKSFLYYYFTNFNIYDIVHNINFTIKDRPNHTHNILLTFNCKTPIYSHSLMHHTLISMSIIDNHSSIYLLAC